MPSLATLPPWLNRPDAPSLEQLVDDFALFAFTCCTVTNREQQEVPFIETPMQRRVNAIEDAMRRELGYAWLYQLKMRRGGLSMNTQLRNLWRIWRRPNTRGVTLAHERESTDEIFQISRLAFMRFPEELLPVPGRERQRAISFPEMGSRFFTGTAGATAVGRGSDFTFLHVSEFAFVPKPRELHKSASQAVRKVDGTYILETTASAWDSFAHKMWQEARAGRSKFRAVFFEWWWRDDAYLPLHDVEELGALSDEEQELLPTIVAHQVQLDVEYFKRPPDPARAERAALSQLKWRRDKIQEIGPEDFDQEYPKDDTSCWLEAGAKFFDGRALRWMRSHTVRDPIRTEKGGELRIYAEPDPNKRYLIGVDPSEGVAGDRSAACVIEYESWQQVAAFSSRITPPEELGDIAAMLGRRYLNARTGAAVIVPERNSAGHTTVYQLTKILRYPGGRIWHDKKMVEGKLLPAIGWRTTEETKHIALNDGAELVRNHDQRPMICDKETLEDMLAVQRGETGKVELTGKDLAVAWLLAYQGRKHPVSAGFPSGASSGGEKSEAAQTINRRH